MARRRPELTSAPSMSATTMDVLDGVAVAHQTSQRQQYYEPVGLSEASEEPILVGQIGYAAAGEDDEHARNDVQGESDEPTERSALLGDDGRSTSAAHGTSRSKSWYKRPSPAWIMAHMLGFALGMGMIIAPRLDQFTQVICHQVNHETAMSHAGSPDLPMLLLDPEQCRHSTSVQKRLAELNLLMQFSMGVLCVLTTPYWGALSDRIGRKPVLSLNMLSFVLGDIVLLVVLSFPSKIPYYWLLLYPAFEGLFAGIGGGQSIMSAYIGDCTEAGSRSGTFSTMMGILFGGVAVGPAISSILIELTGMPLIPFYVVLAVHVVQTFFIWQVVPESLSQSQQKEAKRLQAEKQAEAAEHAREERLRAKQSARPNLRQSYLAVKRFLAPVAVIFAPIALLGPVRAANGSYDWSLPLVAAANGLYSMLVSIYSIKMQYAQLRFGWTSVQLGNFMSLMGTVRIVALLVCIPLLVKLVRRPHVEPVREGLATPNDSTLLEPGVSGFSKLEDEEWDRHKAQHRLIHDYKFDLVLARISILIDTAAYTALAFTTTSSYFLICVMCQALGTGANPALSSLALMFADPKQTGTLMGAMGIFSVMFAQIIGPVLFNGVFAATVDSWPEAFFALGASIFFLTFVALLAVRVRRPKWNGYSVQAPNSSTSNIVLPSE